MKIACYLSSTYKNRKQDILRDVATGLSRWEDVDIVEGEIREDCDAALLFAPPGDLSIPKQSKAAEFRRRIIGTGAGIIGVDGGLLKPKSLVTQDRSWWWKPDGMWRVFWWGQECKRFQGPQLPWVEDCPPDRFEALGYPIEPWRQNGSHVVICGSTEPDHRMNGSNINAWGQETVDLVRKYTDRALIFRPHPADRNKTPQIKGAEWSRRPLKEDLEDAWCTVCEISTVEIEAILSGIPNISLHPWSFAREMSGKIGEVENTSLPEDYVRRIGGIENPYMPRDDHRQKWANNLGYWQWTREEMRQGCFWGELREMASDFVS